MKKTLLGLVVLSVVVLSAVQTTVAMAGDSLTMAQPLLPASGVQKSGSLSGVDLTNIEASRNVLDLFTWADFLKLIKGHNNIKVTYDVRNHLNGTPYCQASVEVPKLSSLEKLVGVTDDQLWQIGYTGAGSFAGMWYFFTVPMGYCPGGGGGSALQFAANYIWLLIILAIMAMLAAGIIFGGRLSKIPTR